MRKRRCGGLQGGKQPAQPRMRRLGKGIIGVDDPDDIEARAAEGLRKKIGKSLVGLAVPTPRRIEDQEPRHTPPAFRS
jgi:hypothetical protein